LFSLPLHPFLLASFAAVTLDRMCEVTNILAAIERGDQSAPRASGH